jgi:hypothetical protein
LKHPDEDVRLCPECRIPIVCDGGIVPRHGRKVEGVAVWPCPGVGLKGEPIKEKKNGKN